MTIALVMLAGGLALLIAGGESLVRGAVGLAEKARVSPLLIGLVIVGFGTSTPELVTSIEAALAGSSAIAWGNIVGSNIANSLLILGAAALLSPISLKPATARRDTGVALAASLSLVAVAATGLMGLWIGAAMVAMLAAYVLWCYREERRAEPDIVHNAAYDRAQALELTDPGLHTKVTGWTRPVVLTGLGLVLLIVGGRFLVAGAIDLARFAGLAETLIGLTIVAVGTSLPELVTSLVAARKGEAGVAFGNVVGSNIYNILFIGGATMLIAPSAVPSALLPVDLGVMAATAVLLFLAALTLGRVGRLAGLGLVALYGAYLAFLVVYA